MLSIGVLASTNATDLEAVLEAIKKKKLNAKVAVLISDKNDALALALAKRHQIPAFFLDPREFRHVDSKELRRELFERKVHGVFQKYSVELILLIGFMRIISSFLIKKYPNRIMNIHPSLLPEFGGDADLDVHTAVLKAGKKKSGCTLHFVNEQLDCGPIILQEEVMIDPMETPASLKAKVQRAEQEVLIRALQLYSEGKISVSGDKVTIRD